MSAPAEGEQTTDEDEAVDDADTEPVGHDLGRDMVETESADEQERDAVSVPIAGPSEGPSDSFGIDDSDSESKRPDDRDDDSSSFGEGLL